VSSSPSVADVVRARVRRRLVAAVSAAALLVALPSVGSAAASPVASSPGSVSPVTWTPPSEVNRTPSGSTPTGTWTATAPLTSGTRSSAADPATVSTAAGAMGASPTVAGSAAAGTGLGVQGSYGLETFALSKAGGLQAQVNLSNGNLVVHSTDLKINAPGLSVRLDRFYNSLSTGSGAFGAHTVLSTGRDVGLQVGSSSVTFTGPSGFTAVFTGTGPTYTAPAGVNATLKKSSDGTFTLTYNTSSEKLTFTAGGYLTSDADRNGNTIALLYNTDNTLASLTDTAGRVTGFQYINGNIQSYTDPAGRHTNYGYDGSGNLVQVTDPNGQVSKYTYDTSNRLTRIQTAAGSITDITYDSTNRVSSVKRYLTANSTTGGSATTTFAYPSSTSTTETDPGGHVTTDTLDAMGRVTAVKNALGQARSQTWTPNSNLATAVDATGSGTTAGNTTKFSYDSNNNLMAVSIPSGAGAAAQYANSTTSGSACSSTDTTHPYLAKCSEDAQGNQASATYDTAGNQTSSTDTTAGATSGVKRSSTYQGDSGVSCGGKPGQVCSATTGTGNTTRYAYNSNGELTSVTPPAPGTATTYGYDSMSRLTSVVTPNGVTVRYEYDMIDQHTKTTWSNGGEVNYFYDLDGDPTGQTDSVGGNQTYTYDGLDRETSVTPPNAGTAASVTYTPAGNVATYTDASGTVTYTYNAANQLTALAEPGGSCTGTVTSCTTFAYNANGALTTTTFPGGTTETTTRDKSGRATEIKAVNGTTVLSDLAYRYTTAAGKDTALVQARTDKLGVGAPANSTTAYTYDTIGRLTKAAETTSAGAANASWAYAYDKDGNRTSAAATLSGATTTLTQGYNAIDELTSLNGATTGLSYDADGNQLSNPGYTPSATAKITATTVNDRDQLTATTANGTPTTAGYLGELQTDLVSANDGTTTTTYQNTLLGLTSATASGATTSFVRTPAGRLIVARSGTSHAYYLTDLTGSTVGIVNAAGSKIAAYAYDPYGRTRTATGTYATTNPFRWDGGLYNTATGAYKFGARYYDTATGRFTQPDPSGQETNPYAFAGDNPVNGADSSGFVTVAITFSACIGAFVEFCDSFSVDFVHGKASIAVEAGFGYGLKVSISLEVGGNPSNYYSHFSACIQPVGVDIYVPVDGGSPDIAVGACGGENISFTEGVSAP